jgi:transposase InsO family protein
LYYLHQDTALKVSTYVPTSVSTIWRILRQHGRIAQPSRRLAEPLERPAPMVSWQIDFKDVTSVVPDPQGDGKRQHVVETLNIVDVGSSMVVDAQVHADYNAETVLTTMAEIVQQHGLPKVVTFDRDPRFVGSWSGRDFPAAWVRFWHCLGVIVNICPPRRPDRNAFVERYHRSYQAECLAIQHPKDEDQARQVTAAYITHYNAERPNQALSCANRPPRVAFPTLPALPSVPAVIEPDAWLKVIDGLVYVRRVNQNGCVTLNCRKYYLKRALAGRYVDVKIDATTRQLIVLEHGQPLKYLPLKDLHHGQLRFADYVDLIAHQARQEWRRHRSATRRGTMF